MSGDQLRWYESSPGVRRAFCSGCGCSIFYERQDAPDEVDVAICLLQTAHELDPSAHIWLSDRLDWAGLEDHRHRHLGALPASEPTEVERSVRCGDLYWIEPDGISSTHRHPYLVIQDDVLNRSRIRSVVACGLTSNLKRGREPGNVLLDPAEGGLERQSVVLVSQIDTLHKAQLTQYIGQLCAERVAEVRAGLRFQQRSFFDSGR